MGLINDKDSDLLDFSNLRTLRHLHSITAPGLSRTIRPLIRNAIPIFIAASEVLLVTVYSAIILSTFKDPAHDAHPFGVTRFMLVGAVVAGLHVLMLAMQGQYRAGGPAGPARRLALAGVCWTASVAFLAATTAVLGAHDAVSRDALIGLCGAGLVLGLAIRHLGARLLRQALPLAPARSRDVVVLDVADTLDAAAIDELADGGCRILARFAANGTSDAARDLDSQLSALVAFCSTHPVDEVIVSIPWGERQTRERIIEALRVLPLPVLLAPDRTARELLRRPAVRYGALRLTRMQDEPLTRTGRVLKRAVDIAVSSAALALLLPVFAVIAVLVRIDSPGPVFFRQARGGFAGRPFRIYKFRSMHTLEEGPAVRQARRGDDRITRVGAVLRRTSLDELPQLINVLRGDMSIVGPRPHALAHDCEYRTLIDSYALRHHVKPGITGWAQANGFRGETPTIDLMRSRVDHDLWYIENWSLWLDVRTILRTAATLLRCDRAF